MRAFYIICFVLFFVGCTNERKQDGVELLNHEILDIPEILIGSSMDIQKDGDCLVVLDYKQDSLFHGVDLLKNLYIGMFGEKGQGPDGFIYPSSLKGLGNGRFSCYDIATKKVSEFCLNREGKTVEFSRFFKSLDMITFDVVPVLDGLFIVSGETDGAMFALINEEGVVLSVSDEYPYKDEEEKKIPVKFRAMAYQGTLRVNSKGYFAYAMLNAKQLHLYKVENKMIRKVGEVIDGYGHYKPNMHREGGYGVEYLGESSTCYMDLAVTDKYVYALYSGRSFKEYQLAAYEGQIIIVYDWAGRIVKTYQLDVPINQFCIDEIKNVIYATANIPDPTIVRFKFE